MSIQSQILVVGPYQVNCYLVWDSEDGQGVIIDPGEDALGIKAAVSEAGFTPKGILLTHGHFDHTGAVNEIVQAYDIGVYAGREEAELLKDSSLNGSAMLGRAVSVDQPDHLLDDEQLLRAGKLEFRVLATPGHSPGGVCFLHESEGTLYCGDSLFHLSIGRTDLPGGSTETLIKAIHKKIMTLPDSVICYPGHGPHTTVGAERISNPFLQGGQFA